MRAPEMHCINIGLTAIQHKLMGEYKAQGYERYKAASPQAQGEVLMRRELAQGQAVVQIIHRDGRTVTRSQSRIETAL